MRRTRGLNLGTDAGRDGSYRWLLWSIGDGLNERPTRLNTHTHTRPVAGRGGDPVDMPDSEGHFVRIHTLS
jgi:hypothetical protein